MAATTTTVLPVTASSTDMPLPPVRSGRQRRIDPVSGRALEILGHAIDYLTDEMVYQGQSTCTNDGRLEAVQLLMAVNRQVYYQCPEVLTFAERFRSLLHLRSA